MSKAYEPRLKTKYREQIRAKLQEQFNYSNPMLVPKVEKVVINMGVGEAVADSKKIKSALAELERIAGQKPVATKARKSIAGFKVREGMLIGCKVTLRRDRMWEFLDRLTNIALPRVKDFRGLNGKSFESPPPRAPSRPAPCRARPRGRCSTGARGAPPGGRPRCAGSSSRRASTQPEGTGR